MNNDTFDNKIRQKIHAVEPEFEEEAWAKIAPQLQKVAPKPLWNKPYPYLAAAAMAILGIGLWLTLSDTPPPAKDAHSITTHSPTTVAPATKDSTAQAAVSPLEKPTYKNSNTYPQNNAPISTSHENNLTPSLKAQTISVNNSKEPKLPPTVVPQESRFVEGYPQPLSPVIPNKIDTAFSHTQIEKIAPENSQSPSMLVEETPHSMKQQIIENAPIPSEKGTEIRSLSFKDSPSLLSSEKYTPALPLPDAPILPLPTHLKWGISPGISVAVAKDVVTYGGLVNLAFHPKWSVNLGLNYVTHKEKRFENEAEFLEETSTEFRTIVSTTPSTPSINITDISFKRTAIELPISIQFRQPIYKGLSFVGQGGTNVFLRANQDFQFAVQEPGKPEMGQDFHHHPRPSHPVNRFPISLAAGLQLQKGHFQLNALPTFMVNAEPNMARRRGDKMLPIAMQLGLLYRL